MITPNGYGERTGGGLGWYVTSGPLQDRTGAGLGALGLDLTDITGGFSMQTVMLVAGAGLLLFLLMGRGGRELEYRQMVSGTKAHRNKIKQLADQKVRSLEAAYDEYRRTGMIQDKGKVDDDIAGMREAVEILEK